MGRAESDEQHATLADSRRGFGKQVKLCVSLV